MTHGLFTMTHGKNLSNDVRKMIVKKHEEGLGYRKISTELRIPVSTIGVIIRKLKNCGSNHDNQKTGRQQNLKISSRTVNGLLEKCSKTHSQPVQKFRRTCCKHQGKIYKYEIYFLIYQGVFFFLLYLEITWNICWIDDLIFSGRKRKTWLKKWKSVLLDNHLETDRFYLWF